MPNLKLNVAHSLEQQDAIDRLRTFFSELRQEHKSNLTDHKEEWVENTLRYQLATPFFSTRGTLTVESTHVELNGEMPITAVMFKDRIEAFLREHLEKALS